jgi:sodium transport system ATP-binding protein
VITVQSLDKSYDSHKAAQGISFSAPDGRVTGLLGPNGAGKTTTLRCITGLLRPDRGTVRLGHLDPASDPGARRALGYLPERAGLYPRFSVWENLLYAAELSGLSKDAGRQRARALIVRLQIEALTNRPGESLSQGERRRVALARALLHSPQNVVLDEPGNGLDIQSLQNLRAIVLELAHEGRAVLLSTHVMQDVERLCDNVVILSRGAVVAEGSPQELKERTGADNLESAVLGLVGNGEGLR